MTTPHDPITRFLHATSFAVAGASRDRSKYGNIVFQALVRSGRTTFPLNPSAESIEGYQAYPTLASVPASIEALSIVTPPHVTRQIVEQAIAAGVRVLWMQPGAEESIASQRAREAGIEVIDDGSCVLVALAIERKPS